LAPFQAQFPAWVPLLALLAISLVLIFAGRKLVKLVVFLAVGIAGATIGGILAAQFLSPGGELLGVLIGFIAGGLLGVGLISMGIGIAVGYAAYLLALDLAISPTIAAITGVTFFIVGLALSGKILTLATAVVGGLLLFNVLTSYGLGPSVSTAVAALLTLMGLWVQMGKRRHAGQPSNQQTKFKSSGNQPAPNQPTK